MLNLPKWSIVNILRAKGTHSFDPADRPVIGICNQCGAELVACVYMIKNNETQEVIDLGSTCVKKYTGKTAHQIDVDNYDYYAEEERLQAFHVVQQRFYQLNKKFVDWLEQNYNACDYYKSLYEQYLTRGCLSLLQLNHIKIAYIKSKYQFTDAEQKINLDKAIVFTAKFEQHEYDNYLICNVVKHKRVYKLKIGMCTKLGQSLLVYFDEPKKLINRTISLNATIKNINHNTVYLTRLSLNK